MTKTEAVSIEFHFEQDVTEKDLKSIVRKVETVRKNADYQTLVSYFADRHNIVVVLTFIDADGKLFDCMRTPLTRLIDSHKQVAFYGWGLSVKNLTEEMVGA